MQFIQERIMWNFKMPGNREICLKTGWIGSNAAALFLFAGALLVSGCSGLNSFSIAARAGDTIAISAYRQVGLKRNNIVFRITDSTNFTQDIPGSDPSIRLWVNAYPDPVSKMIVGKETHQDLGIQAQSVATGAEVASNGTKDWYDTMLLVDLPANLAVGTATIDVLHNGQSVLLDTVAVEVIPGVGTPTDFAATGLGGMPANYLQSAERANHFRVVFSGSTVPSAVQVEITHNPDKDNGGNGQAFVTQPRADINAISWTDDGTTLRVIVMPSWHKTAEDLAATSGNPRKMNWFDFYVAGNINGLQTPIVSAFDENGSPVPGVTASIQ